MISEVVFLLFLADHSLRADYYYPFFFTLTVNFTVRCLKYNKICVAV